MPLHRALAPFAVLLLAAPAAAQIVAPYAGEHDSFTRLVVPLPPDTPWSLSPDGRTRTLTLGADTLRIRLDRVFQRIPRDRLADIGADGSTIRLDLACDCPIRAWEDRPGLLILDISDAAPQGPEAPSSPDREPRPVSRPEPRPVGASRPDPMAAARAAGAALARSRPAQPVSDAPATPEEDAQLQDLGRELGAILSTALGQGVLDPAVDAPMPSTQLLSGPEEAPADFPSNMRVTSVLDRDDPSRLADPPRPPQCDGSEVLDAVIARDVGDFDTRFGELSRALYGEFDQPDPQALRDLVGLYLAVGFGAEARALIGAAETPLEGQEFLLGMADIFEDRSTNSRMQLAQSVECGGTASVLAVLAGADPALIRDHADRIALTFINLPNALQDLIGIDLSTMLAQAGAVDAARVVADRLQRSGRIPPEQITLLEARLDRARGLAEDAIARLDHEGGSDTDTVTTRLDLALDTDQPLSADYLATAEVLATTERSSGSGPEMMAAVIRLHARSGAHTDAFAALDRLETWMPETGENRQMITDLRDTIWSALAENGTDFALTEAVLARDDWRDPELSEATREALAARLLDLGLALPARDLAHGSAAAQARILQARTALETDDAQGALVLLGDDDSAEAAQVRAAAMDRLGDHAAAARAFAELGITDAALRAAILAGDWRRVEQLSPAEADAATIGPLLGRDPGHAEIALEQGGTEPDAQTASEQTPQPDQTERADDTPATPPEDVVPADPGAVFDRLGLVQRSSTLLSESARLREALAPLVTE
ncbi:hypothetical protein JI664_19170 [Rhodobacter sp. NTK016B]|uniref:hypothetical protein n=1 Tax=Rhodobacter sp. NTK016B TaxID=2759676 RepID=UPI001A8EE55A|nr:hypothetical protein [Rhodobacter sp. NTK016B]MBN8294100.1 hypothetical protein [Rhodobacter sp. NTK016B]